MCESSHTPHTAGVAVVEFLCRDQGQLIPLALFLCPLCCRVVGVCEASVMVAVSTEHRREALEAVSYTIDQVKSTATIWKKVHLYYAGVSSFCCHNNFVFCLCCMNRRYA